MPCWPIFGASPDSISEDYVIEIKCPKSVKTRANYVNGSGIVQPKYNAQIQLQMLLCGRKKGLFCVASPSFESDGKVDVIEVDYDDVFISGSLIPLLPFGKNPYSLCCCPLPNARKSAND